VSDYESFLREKIKLAAFDGFDVPIDEINPALKPHTRDIARWVLKGGNRAVFASFGLHKTATHLEVLRQVGRRFPDAYRMGVVPLGVRHEFFREAEQRFTGECSVDLRFIRRDSEIDDPATIYLTNYEAVREGNVTPARFRAAGLDEASILRSYGSKTYQEFLPAFSSVEFKSVYTATPDPNRYKELIHYAGYLGVMDTGQALTRFFQRDSEKAGNLTLYPHKEAEFWLWVASWAVFITKPSDLGHSDEGYVLPPIDVRWHEIESDYAAAGEEKNGQGLLIPDLALGLSAAATEKRNSMAARVAIALEFILDGSRQASQAPREEQSALRGQQGEVQGQEQGLARGEPGALQGGDAEAQREEPRQDEGAQCGVVQAEQDQSRSNGAPKQAETVRHHAGAEGGDPAAPRASVPDLRAVPRGIEQASGGPLACDRSGSGSALLAVQRSTRPAGRQRRKSGAGDRVSEHASTSGLPQVVVWVDLNDEQRELERALDAAGITYSSLYGSQSIDERESLLEDWREKRTTVLLTKTTMYGAGVNLQQANRMVFVGVHYKFNDLIQGVHRIHRFQQTKQCQVLLIHTEAEAGVKDELLAKWRRHDEQQQRMAELVRTYGLDQLAMQDTLARTIGVKRREVSGERFTVANNDCVLEARLRPDNSVDLIVTSIPFANHYEYTPSYNDFGHTENNDHFWRQMDFLTPELYRILKPGRIAAIHVKDRVLFGNVTGLGRPSMDYFHEEASMHLRKHGFHKLGMVTITTDVVRENNQTYRLSYTEMCKDGTKMGVGCSEYLLVFFKPQTDLSRGYADVPVSRSKADYSLARWQIDAHAYWRSSGNRLLTAEELAAMGPGKLAKYFTEDSLRRLYDYERHIAVGEQLDQRGALPREFACLQPGSTDPMVWTDITRMLTLNSEQSRRAVEKHVCPLQFDIVDRAIERWSMRDELVYDPFHGLGTVGVRAIKAGRRAGGSELSSAYFADQVHYLQAAEREFSMPTLFDLEEFEREAA
jgi:DNA modification methylase